MTFTVLDFDVQEFDAQGFMHYFSRGGGVSKSGGEWKSA
jgi:hypothetical protein